MIISKEIREKLVEAYLKGDASVVIGKRFGVSHCTVLKSVRLAGHPIRRKGGSGPRLDFVKHKKVFNLKQQGKTNIQISKLLRVTRQRVYQILRKAKELYES